MCLVLKRSLNYKLSNIEKNDCEATLVSYPFGCDHLSECHEEAFIIIYISEL